MTIKQQGGIFGRNPTFNNVEIDGSITSDGQAKFGSLGVGTLPATKVHVVGSNANLGTVELDSDPSVDFVGLTMWTKKTVPHPNSRNWQVAANYQGYGTFDIMNSTTTTGAPTTPRLSMDNVGNVTLNTGNLAFASGKGIDFSATSGTGTSELFDDYEEGTFTPTLYGNATAGTYELATASGTYTKVGRVVTAQVLLVLAGSVTGGGSGDTVIGGLPFTYDGSENPGQHSAVASGGISFAAGATVTASRITSSDDTRLTLYESVAGTSIATVPITDFGANDLVSFTVTYFSI